MRRVRGILEGIWCAGTPLQSVANLHGARTRVKYVNLAVGLFVLVKNIQLCVWMDRSNTWTSHQ